MAEVNIEIEIDQAVQNVVVQPESPQVDIQLSPIVSEVNIEVSTGNTGSGLDVTRFVVGETPSGLINGSNATFTTAFAFIPELLEVFCNGILQKKIIDYNTSGNNTISLTFSPSTTEIITVSYIKQ